MSGDGNPWRSGAAEFDDVGFSLVKRDIEVLMLAVQNLTASLQNVGVDSATVKNLFDEFVDGRTPWGVSEGGTGAQTLTGYVVGTGTDALTATATIPWADLTGVPATFPPDGTVTVNVNSSDTTDSAALTISGTFAAQTWTFYEKRPRFNAKWLLGAELATSVGAVSGSTSADTFLWWDKTNAKWATFDFFNPSAVTGWVQCFDSTAADTNAKMTGVMAGTAVSVFGRATNSAGLPAAIAAGADDQILGRRAGALTWATIGTNEITAAAVTKAKMENGAAISVIGRSANSAGVTADIAGAANQVLACNGTPALAFSRTITLGDASNAGSITIGNATSTTAIVISPTLVNAAGKILSVREIDVCDAGVAKKMLVLASAPY